MNWDKIIEELGPKLFRYFCGSFDSWKADDLVQEVFLRCLKRFRDGGFDPEKGSLKMYAYGIAHYVRLEELARRRFEIEDVDPGSESAREASDLMDLRSAIAKLSHEESQIILLMINGDLSMEEISNFTKIPVGTVKSHVHRAKEKLRELLNVRRT